MPSYRDQINAACRAIGLPSYFVTERVDGSIELPGLIMGPAAGPMWSYREAQDYDVDNGAWHGEESGAMVDLDLAEAIGRAAARVMATDEQLAALRKEAAEAGDLAMAKLCASALLGDNAARAECFDAICEARAASRDA